MEQTQLSPSPHIRAALKRNKSRSASDGTPQKKLNTDLDDAEVSLAEMGEHLEFDIENFYVKEHYNEVYLEENKEGDPTEFKLSTKEKKALDREIPFRLIPDNQKENYFAALGK